MKLLKEDKRTAEPNLKLLRIKEKRNYSGYDNRQFIFNELPVIVKNIFGYF